ncbi:putative uridine phosphorylase [Trichuris suis]|nr:putative uridine phosphorylase [Trichuris suis]
MANGAKRKQIQPINDDVIDASDFRELCHLGIRADDADVEKEFSSVQFVFFCKSANSALRMAEHIGARLPNALPYGMEPINLSNNNTYAVYKVGPVLCVSHGLGEAPCLITLHELTKLLRSASNVFPYYFLVGKCTGLGAEPGTIILTTASVNGILKPYFETFRLGKKVKYASVTDQHMVALAAEVCNELKVKHVKGLTLGTNDYYEGEGRRSETLCCGTSETKKSFFERAQVLGVRNFRMESTCFAAFCNRAQIKAAVISVVCLNRLHSEDAVIACCFFCFFGKLVSSMSELPCLTEFTSDPALHTVLTSGSQVASTVEVFEGIIAHLQDWQTSIVSKAADEVKKLKEEYTAEALELINAVADVDNDERNTEVSFELLSTTRNKIEVYERLKNTNALVEIALHSKQVPFFDSRFEKAFQEAEETVDLLRRIRNYYAKELRLLVATLGLHVAIGTIGS